MKRLLGSTAAVLALMALAIGSLGVATAETDSGEGALVGKLTTDDYGQYVQLTQVQTVAGQPLVIAPDRTEYLLLAESGQGLSRFTALVEPAGELRGDDEVTRIMEAQR